MKKRFINNSDNVWMSDGACGEVVTALCKLLVVAGIVFDTFVVVVVVVVVGFLDGKAVVGTFQGACQQASRNNFGARCCYLVVVVVVFIAEYIFIVVVVFIAEYIFIVVVVFIAEYIIVVVFIAEYIIIVVFIRAVLLRLYE